MNSSFRKIINGTKPVLIDFHATWCGPCKAMSPIVSAIAKEWKGKVKVIKIDIDKNSQLSHNLKIKGVPTFMLYKNGHAVWRQSGMITKAELNKVIKKNIE